MKFLIIGLGSMGQRRIRCLKALGYNDIVGWDKNFKLETDIPVIETEFGGCDVFRFLKSYHDKFDAIFICVPPLAKQTYIDLANQYKIPCFCEADIQTYLGDYCPSSTFRFHPAILKIKELLDSGTLGQVYTFNYHMGQHLRDWHPGADYTNYYAAKKESGACREMFAFELSWLSYLFGTPVDAKAFIDKKLSDFDISADDVFATCVKFSKKPDCVFGLHESVIGDLKIPASTWQIIPETITGTVLIDIVSRPAVRNLRIVGEKGMLEWDWQKEFVSLCTNGEWMPIPYEKGKAAEGYNENISEQPYIDEIADFIKSVKVKPLHKYAYSMQEEKAVIEMLKKVEESV